MTAPVEIEIPFGRLDIADYLGLTVETISRELSKLKHDGLISTKGPHTIVLRRLGGLREIARIGADDEGGSDEPETPNTLDVAPWSALSSSRLGRRTSSNLGGDLG